MKADPGRHPEAEVFPVMKLNAVRDFQTGIYDYNVMTSTFLRVAAGWPVAKVSFSSQEWCGHVVAPADSPGGPDRRRLPQLLRRRGGRPGDPRDARGRGPRGRAAGPPARLEGRVPAKPGESRTRSVPAQPAPRPPQPRSPGLDHGHGHRAREKPRRSRCRRVLRGRSRTRWTWRTGGGSPSQIEAAAPWRLVRQTGPDGEELALAGSKRLAYWQLNAPGGEKYLKEIGLE